LQKKKKSFSRRKKKKLAAAGKGVHFTHSKGLRNFNHLWKKKKPQSKEKVGKKEVHECQKI
jgi:hypothetical protein